MYQWNPAVSFFLDTQLPAPTHLRTGRQRLSRGGLPRFLAPKWPSLHLRGAQATGYLGRAAAKSLGHSDIGVKAVPYPRKSRLETPPRDEIPGHFLRVSESPERPRTTDLGNSGTRELGIACAGGINELRVRFTLGNSETEEFWCSERPEPEAYTLGD